MRQRTGRDESHGQEEHRTSTAEQGAFSYANCSCGWSGPARRARSASRADGTAHLAGHSGSGSASAAGEGDGNRGGDGTGGLGGPAGPRG